MGDEGREEVRSEGMWVRARGLGAEGRGVVPALLAPTAQVRPALAPAPVTCQGLGVGGFLVSVRVTLQDHWAHMGRPHCCPRTRVRHFSTAAAPRPHGPRGPPACPSSLHLGPQVWRKQNK